MSNAFLRDTAGTLPPSVAESYQTDNGTAVALNHILIVHGADSTQNNANGIITNGGVVGTGVQNEVDAVLTNRIRGTATTTDDVTSQSIYSFALGATPGTYLLEVRVIGFNVTDNLSAGYTSYRVVRTTGAAATSVSAAPGIVSEEGIMTGVNVVNGVSGNSATLSVTGLSGKTIHWLALTTYIFVG